MLARLAIGILIFAPISFAQSIAVVNPVVHSPLRETRSLDGTWDFATDPTDIGEKEQWFAPDHALPNKRFIKLPGCWEAQGVGEEGNSKPQGIEQSVRPLRHQYTGVAWYKKSFDLPDKWINKHLWLKVGGVNSEAQIWVNGLPISRGRKSAEPSSISSYCGTSKFDIGVGTPMEVLTIVIKVRNDVPSKKGLQNWIERFGGIYRSIEIDATGPVFIDDVWVEPHLDQGKATIHGYISNPGAIDRPFDLDVTAYTAEEKIAGRVSTKVALLFDPRPEVTVDVKLDPLLPWSPESPTLYTADIILRAGNKKIDGFTTRFGIKKFEVRDGHFYLNNHRYFLRGFGDDYIYPLTISSPASREEHLRHLRIAKSYGFNYVRNHTHCEVPEYYEAADEVGIMVQPELAYYGNRSSTDLPEYFHPKDDLRELIENYRRYVSFSTISLGNEAHMGSPLDVEMYKLAKQLDPARVIIHNDGGKNTPENSDWGKGIHVEHEYLNLAVEEDPRIDKKYTGALLPPRKYEDFKNEIVREALPLDLAEKTFDAGHQLQKFFQKEGIESNRLNPNSDGYIYWTIVDVGNPAAQGLLDQFWDRKGATPEEFREFNGPTPLLAGLTPYQHVFQVGDKPRIDWRSPNVDWQLASHDRVYLTGSGNSELTMPDVAEPTKLTLTGTIHNTDIKNHWEMWVFPNVQPDPQPQLIATKSIFDRISKLFPKAEMFHAEQSGEIIVCDELTKDVLAQLNAGASVLLVNLSKSFKTIQPGIKLGWWIMSEQRGTAIASSKAFGSLPNEGYLSPMLFDVFKDAALWSDIKGAEPLMLSHTSKGWASAVFEARVGKGKLLAVGLDVLSEKPDAKWLLRQFVQYVGSENFKALGTLNIPAH